VRTHATWGEVRQRKQWRAGERGLDDGFTQCVSVAVGTTGWNHRVDPHAAGTARQGLSGQGGRVLAKLGVATAQDTHDPRGAVSVPVSTPARYVRVPDVLTPRLHHAVGTPPCVLGGRGRTIRARRVGSNKERIGGWTKQLANAPLIQQPPSCSL